MNEQIVSNKRRALLIVAAFVLVVTLVLWTVELLLGLGLLAMLVTLALVAAGAFAAYWKADAVALALSRARPAEPHEHARLHNLVEGLCVAAGLRKPGVYVIDDDAPNAFAVGRSPRHAAVVVTTGLLERMSRIELEGVLAHELSHVKSYDVLVSSLAVVLVGLPLMVAGPVASRAIRLAVSRSREALADFSGVQLTRYPPGLVAALEKLKDHPAAVQSGSRATAHLWIESPLVRTGADGRLPSRDRLSDTHPPLEDRIQALKEL
ncbi:MAG TPA: M48 family metallopeptidase [Acidimicrobiales bacterium]|nr:M48 family metallopeptidase [Acidimicrobiales bacterium]